MSEIEMWVIGSGHDCHLRVDGDPFVSPRHAAVTRDTATGRVRIADLGSTNGTRVERDGARFTVERPVELMLGDTIWVGRTAIPWRGAP